MEEGIWWGNRANREISGEQDTDKEERHKEVGEINMINNTCSGCGKEVWIRSKGNSYLNKMLKESTTVVCKNCDPISDWKRRKQNESI